MIQKELANMIGVTDKSVSKWKRDQFIKQFINDSFISMFRYNDLGIAVR